MQWNSLSEFLQMGGHALYVWGSFGMTATALLVEALALRQRRHNILSLLRQRSLVEPRPPVVLE